MSKKNNPCYEIHYENYCPYLQETIFGVMILKHQRWVEVEASALFESDWLLGFSLEDIHRIVEAMIIDALSLNRK